MYTKKLKIGDKFQFGHTRLNIFQVVELYSYNGVVYIAEMRRCRLEDGFPMWKDSTGRKFVIAVDGKFPKRCNTCSIYNQTDAQPLEQFLKSKRELEALRVKPKVIKSYLAAL